MTGLVCIGTTVQWVGWYGERVRLDFDTPAQADSYHRALYTGDEGAVVSARAAERRARADA